MKKLKQQLRKKMIFLLAKQKEEDRRIKSNRISKMLFSLPQVLSAKVMLFYVSFDGEVETISMMKKAGSLGKRILVPLIKKKTRQLKPVPIDCQKEPLGKGPYGILQPRVFKRCRFSLSDLDVVVAPGIAFDLDGNRLGRGLGYYDRFLYSLPKKVFTIGLGFSFQVFDRLAVTEPHDVSVHKILYA